MVNVWELVRLIKCRLIIVA